MSRIIACMMTPFAMLFAGLSPAYLWAIPLAIGSVIVMLVLLWNDQQDAEYNKHNVNNNW